MCAELQSARFRGVGRPPATPRTNDVGPSEQDSQLEGGRKLRPRGAAGHAMGASGVAGSGAANMPPLPAPQPSRSRGGGVRGRLMPAGMQRGDTSDPDQRSAATGTAGVGAAAAAAAGAPETAPPAAPVGAVPGINSSSGAASSRGHECISPRSGGGAHALAPAVDVDIERVLADVMADAENNKMSIAQMVVLSEMLLKDLAAAPAAADGGSSGRGSGSASASGAAPSLYRGAIIDLMLRKLPSKSWITAWSLQPESEEAVAARRDQARVHALAQAVEEVWGAPRDIAAIAGAGPSKCHITHPCETWQKHATMLEMSMPCYTQDEFETLDGAPADLLLWSGPLPDDTRTRAVLAAQMRAAKLGQGGQAQVLRVRHRETGMEMAIKRVPHGVDSIDDCGDPTLAALGLMGELTMLGQLVDPHKEVDPGSRWATGHPNIIFPYGAMWRPDGTVWLVLELAPMGSLQGLLPTLLDGATPEQRALFAEYHALELAQAMAHCHSRGVLHLDCKPANVLVAGYSHGGASVAELERLEVEAGLAEERVWDQEVAFARRSGMQAAMSKAAAAAEAVRAQGVTPPSAGRQPQAARACKLAALKLLLCDFGVAKVMHADDGKATGVHVGTHAFVAPEVGECPRYSCEVDVHCFTVTMWAMYTGTRPLYDYSDSDELQRRLRKPHAPLRPDLPCDLPPELRSLIMSGWATEPSHRPSVAQLKASLEMMQRTRRELQVQAALKRCAAASAEAGAGPGPSQHAGAAPAAG